eukprot:scaffold31041_cov56-Attheya_sp.AAC.6
MMRHDTVMNNSEEEGTMTSAQIRLLLPACGQSAVTAIARNNIRAREFPAPNNIIIMIQHTSNLSNSNGIAVSIIV